MMALENLPVLYEDNWMMHGVVSRCISLGRIKMAKKARLSQVAE
jgi:hypothetical protein